MPMPTDDLIQQLMVDCLHAAIRRRATAILQAPGTLDTPTFRDVERLMRMAVAMTRSGTGLPPTVYIHQAGRSEPAGGPPELLLVELTDLLAARAGDRLGQALDG